MNKTKYEIYDNALNTSIRIQTAYFKQKDELKKLYDYMIIRQEQLKYAEAKDEIEFISEMILRIIRAE